MFPSAIVRETPGAISSAACGESHTLAITASGGVLAFGSAEDGRLGFDADEEGVMEAWEVGLVPS